MKKSKAKIALPFLFLIMLPLSLRAEGEDKNKGFCLVTIKGESDQHKVLVLEPKTQKLTQDFETLSLNCRNDMKAQTFLENLGL